MVTRFYLRNATSGIAGTLPTAEQSSRTAGDTFEGSDTTNRDMSRFKGTSETSLVNSSLATTSQTDYYISRWVSPILNQTSVAANTWTCSQGFQESNASANFPASASAVFYVNIYVWKPSNGTKYGTIFDGVTADSGGGESTSKCVKVNTVSGSAVSSLTSGDAVIVYELWARITQAAATSYTQTAYYDGTVAYTATSSSSIVNIASYIETPENLSLTDDFVTTKLYLHATTSGLPTGTLPTAEQSTKTVTANCNFEGSQTTNRLMDTSIGTSQASLSLATPADVNSNTFYVSRWVSPVIYQTSVAAGTWIYNFAALESATSLNFPVTSSNKAVWVNCYVWKPSNGTKYGTILDGDTAATISEGTASQEKSQQAEFTGAAVSSLTSGDACIVLEVWFAAIASSSGTSATATFYYDGTTETAGGSTVSNHASLISYAGLAINFTAGGTLFTRALSTETISVSESIARLYTANRPPATETIAISESQVRLLAANRALSAETITIGESMARIYNANRAPTAETNTIGESLIRLYSANRALSDTSAISEAITKVQVLVRALSDTTAISESLARVFGVIKNLSDTTAISEAIARLFVGVRALSTETTIVGESLARLKAANRSLSDTTIISESLARTFGVVRSLTDTTTISESLARVYNAIRSLSDTTAISESLAKVQTLVRSLSDTTAITGTVTRILGINRSLTDTTIISESLSRLLGLTRSLTDTTVITGTVSRIYGAVRSLTDTTAISESLARLIALVRSLSDTTIITGIVDSLYSSGAVGNFVRALATETVSISESLARSISNARSIIETTVIGESLSRILGVVRSLTDSTIISESLSRLQALTRSLTDTTAISESLARVYGAVKNLSDTTTISELLSRFLGLTRSLSDTTIISEILSRIQGLTKTLTDTTAIAGGTVARVFGAVKSLSDTTVISEAISRSVVLTRSLTQSVIILESLIRAIIRVIVDYVPSLETDFKDDIDEMILPYIFAKWNATGQLQKGSNMIDADYPVEFKVGIHSSRPYQVLALEQQTEINKISINKFGGGMWRFFTTVEVTVMVQRLQRDIPIELSQMEKEIQRIICHYTRDEIVGIDDLILVGMRREWSGTNRDWSRSIWSTKIYFKAEYQKVNVENY